jgi:hypothetical protein
MWKNARRLLKILLVWTAIVILTLDVGLAGRIAGRRCRRAAVCSTDECSCNAKSAGGKGSGGGKSLVDPPPTVSMPGHHDDSRPDDGVSSPSDQVAPSPPPVAPPSDLPPSPPHSLPQLPPEPATTPDLPPSVPLTPETPPAAEDDPLQDLLQDPPAPAPEPTPAPAQPSDPLDNLFDDPSPAEEAPAPPVVPESDPLDDLFSDPPSDGTAPATPDAEPATDPLDDLFNDPTSDSESAASDQPGWNPLDDLFSDPIPVNSGAGTNDPSEAADLAKLYDPTPIPGVGTSAAVPNLAMETPVSESAAIPEGSVRELRPLESRRWVDDTGTYSVDGKLMAVSNGKIRILKPTGRTCTVLLSRLSAADVNYVEGVRSRFGRSESLQFVHQ